MHIPDGFINNNAAAGLASVAAFAVAVSLRKVRVSFLAKVPVFKMRLATFPASQGGEMSMQSRLSKFGREKMWRIASIGSLVFAAQMVNFPINGGTSGHLLGGVLASLILGPFEALLVMAVILATQATIFGDGGVIALGANVFNMGIVGALGGYAFFWFLMNGKTEKKKFLTSAFVAAWVSVILASVMASFEIAFSGRGELSVVFPAMVVIHTAIGLVEGIITVAVLSILMKNNFRLETLVKKQDYEK